MKGPGEETKTWRGRDRMMRKTKRTGPKQTFCFSHRWKGFVISVWKGRVKVTQGV